MVLKKYFDKKYNKHVYEVYAGNFFATKDKNVIITTLLGSCVSACLRDTASGVVGLNHFLLPGDVRRDEIIMSPSAKYGLHAMELLINAMMKLGARRDNFEAKVFGGGHVLDTKTSTVPSSNITFIEAYLAMENIPIIAKDVGGNMGRKILFFADTTDVYLKRVQKDKVYSIDKDFLSKVKKKVETPGDVTLFD